MLEDDALKTIKKYCMINKNDVIVVGVSGGPDSMTLLNVLINLSERYNLKIVVAHVNHMMRAVADSETEFVKDFCKKNNIECFIKKFDVVKKSELEKISTEEAGRNVRYDFFDEVFDIVNATKIAIAHNENDNAETVLMNFMRGSGISGLKGIEPVRDNKYIRPLIEINRADIEQYCIDKKLNPKFDESNKENVYTRNKIRNLLIPYLKKEFNPNIIESINRLSNLALQENNYIEKVVNKNIIEITEKSNNNEIVLNLKKFNELDEFIKNQIILKCVKNIFGTTRGIEKVHIDDIVRLCSKNIGNKYLMPNKNLKIFVNNSKISIIKIM